MEQAKIEQARALVELLTEDYRDELTGYGLSVEAVPAIQEVQTPTYDPDDTDPDELEHFDACREALQNSDWCIAGAGYFSLALLHQDDDVVLKVSLNKDDRAPLFWTWCLDRRGQDLIPTIHSVGYFTIDGQDYTYCIMPRLNPIDRIGRQEFEAYREKVEEWGIDQWGYVDLHDGNIMQDDEGVRYITDPLSFPRVVCD